MERRPGWPRFWASTPSAKEIISLTGGDGGYHGVRFTCQERAALDRLYVDRFVAPGLRRTMATCDGDRLAAIDGLRIVAWLARWLEPGDDPLRAVISLAIQAGWDAELWPEEVSNE